MAEADTLPPVGPILAPGDAAAPEPPRWKHWAKVALRVVLALVALVFLAWAILYITKGRFLKGPFERIASNYTHRDIRVAKDFQFYFDPITIKFLAEGLTIANPPWRKGDTMVAQRIETRIATFPLLFGTRRLKWLTLDGAALDLAWDAERARNTFTFGDPDKSAERFVMPDIQRGRISGTRIAYEDPFLKLRLAVDVDTIDGVDTKIANDVRFSGSGSMRDKPFNLSGSLLSPNETASGGENRLQFKANAGPTQLAVSGTLPSATVLENAKLKIGVRGPNLSLLFDFLGVAVPDTRTYRFTANLTKNADAWKFTRLAGFFGQSDLGGTMTVSMPKDRLHIDADVATRRLHLIDAGPFIGYDPARIAAGRVSEVVGGTPRILPDAPLRIESIGRFDADVKYRVRAMADRSAPISNVALTLDLDRSLLTLSPFTFDVAGGHLASDIAIDARRPLVRTSYDIRLSPTPMGRLLGRFGVEQSGTTGTLKARVKMTGEGDSVRKSLATSDGRIAVIIPKGSFWTRNVQLSELDIGTFVQKMFEGRLKEPVQINCGLIAFTVRNGIAAADPILIDTQKNVMLGRGGFSFRNEALDFSFRADGKKFSLIAGQSPVAVAGSFAQPRINVISPELVGRAGAGLGLAIIATPLAGILAFVDVGDAKSAQCGPLLSGATAKAQRTTKGAVRDDVGRGTTTTGEKKPRKKFLGIF